MSAGLLRRLPLLSVWEAVLIVLVVFVLMRGGTVTASGSMPITGYAWSSNIGWTSFSGSGYGVFEDTITRALSGYAWSSNIGWISFSASDGSHPAPTVDFITGQISGYARACSAFADKNACSGALDGNTGGWDGWISLSGTANDGSPYGIVQGTSCGWTGYAWGSDAIGWVSTSGTANDGSPYAVGGNAPASCTHSCIATLTSNPSTVDQGQNVALTWSVTGGSLCAASCTGNGFNTSSAISGTTNAAVPPVPPTTSYGLTCTGGTYGPPPPANTTVTVIVPTATMSVNGQSPTVRVDAAAANNASVAWSSANATSCSVTKNSAAWKTGLSSSGTTDTVTTQVTYAVDCVNSHGTHATSSVLVNILPGYNKF